MECVEEELEPWQKQVPEVTLIEEDDDEPIFVGVLSKNQKDSSLNPPPSQRNSGGKQEMRQSTPKPATASSPIILPLNVSGKPVNTTTPAVPTVTPQPIIVNNQGFIVTPQITNSSDFIASLGSQYPPGTSFTLVPAPQPQVFQRIAQTTLIPGVVHRPQVQQISNNIVTLSNVQGPAVFRTQPKQLQINPINTQPKQILSVPVINQNPSKRVLPIQQVDNVVKRVKANLVSANVKNQAENGIAKHKCPHCQSQFFDQDGLKNHMTTCRPPASAESTALSPQQSSASKRIMLVGDFYYGKFEGDGFTKETQKTTTFKCHSCLKVLKNNIRFMNHMKHHLELEKQNSESFESHTTCQHCYRQYLTPFQLQCHIESAHSPIESTTNCKICELAFESEQVLLDHMKNNHKPGEMPYVCQVCNFRSSFFSDVETHFRNAHENTKDLLCPFCLKVHKSSHIYMQHYMKHQKKGIYRCGKCRLNFLSFKEKVEHRTHVHRTFRKPKALDGLPPGTKVTIRASLTGKPPLIQSSPVQLGLIVASETQSTKQPLNVQKPQLQNSGQAKSKVLQRKKKDGGTSKRNLALKNFRTHGEYTCIECNGPIDDFFTHFPMILNCGACKYRTNCKISIGNHMIRFHSTINKSRFSKMENRKYSSSLKLTIVCLNCDLLVDASGSDLMSKHLTDRPNHICRVILDKADAKAKDQMHPVNGPPAKDWTQTTTKTPKEEDKTLFIGGATTVADSVAQPQLTVKATFPACEQENGSTEMVITEDPNLLQPNLS